MAAQRVQISYTRWYNIKDDLERAPYSVVNSDLIFANEGEVIAYINGLLAGGAVGISCQSRGLSGL